MSHIAIISADGKTCSIGDKTFRIVDLETFVDLYMKDERIAELERQIERMKPVVEAAIAWRKRVAFKLCVADELFLKDAVRKYQEE